MQDYNGLIEYLKGLGAWWHHLDSTWLVKTAKSATGVRDDIAAIVDDDDEVLVINVSGDARAWRGFNAAGSKWLKESF